MWRITTMPTVELATDSFILSRWILGNLFFIACFFAHAYAQCMSLDLTSEQIFYFLMTVITKIYSCYACTCTQNVCFFLLLSSIYNDQQVCLNMSVSRHIHIIASQQLYIYIYIYIYEMSYQCISKNILRWYFKDKRYISAKLIFLIKLFKMSLWCFYDILIQFMIFLKFKHLILDIL